MTRIVEIEPWTRRVREWAGGFSEYEAVRDAAREAAFERFEHAEERRREIEALLARRRQEARAGFGLGEKTGGSDRRGTNALRSKVRLAERALERADRPEKPYEPWELELRLETGERANDRVAALDGATAAAWCVQPRSGRTSSSGAASACSSRGETAAANRRFSGCCSATCRSWRARASSAGGP